jgi:hypothetical protein
MPDLFTLKVDVAQLAAAGKHFADAKAKMPSALAHAVATIGPQATGAMKKVLPGQTGLKPSTSQVKHRFFRHSRNSARGATASNAMLERAKTQREATAPPTASAAPTCGRISTGRGARGKAAHVGQCAACRSRNLDCECLSWPTGL